ncbi:hypothetical protein EG713_23725 [Salmonella enterica]|nr:hypothetical protein [Salmonella enterica]EAS7978020.1 hypothetical protein [Salmonella enterica]EBK4923193.1 hypothetical protein [Salmonella enterica]
MAFSGFRGAALNQSRSASGVYTGLEWWHERDYQERPLAGKFAVSVRKAAYVRKVDMPPPRSLGRWRSGRETAAGGSCSHGTGHHTAHWFRNGHTATEAQKKRTAGKGRGVAVFP